MEPNPYQPPETESTDEVPQVTPRELWQAARQGAKQGAIFGGSFVFGSCAFSLIFGFFFAEDKPIDPLLPRSLQQSSSFSLTSIVRVVGLTITAAVAGTIGGATLGVTSVWSRRKRTTQK